MDITYYQKYINFLKKYNLYNEEILTYIKRNSTHLFYLEEENRDFIGCFYTYDKNNKLTRIHTCIPYIDSDITTLINIHEYIHVFTLYPYLNKKYTMSKKEEILPIFYELLYYLEDPNPILKNEIIELNNKISASGQIEYQIALHCKQELLEYYNKEKPSFKKLQKKAKKISNKYINKLS